MLRPLDETRAYRLEMSTKLSVGEHKDLYAFWATSLTERLAAEARETGAPFVINAASQEYAKAVDGRGRGVPVVTAVCPGPAVHAKTARGEITRFCAERALCTPEELRGFTGAKGEWSFVPAESDDERCDIREGAQLGHL